MGTENQCTELARLDNFIVKFIVSIYYFPKEEAKMSPAKHKTGELFTTHVSIVISRRKAIQVAEEEYNDIHMQNSDLYSMSRIKL